MHTGRAHILERKTSNTFLTSPMLTASLLHANSSSATTPTELGHNSFQTTRLKYAEILSEVLRKMNFKTDC